MATQVGHPLFRLAAKPPRDVPADEVLRWLADEDPLVPPLGVDPSQATVEALHREAIVEAGTEAETELAYIAKRGGRGDLQTGGWVCASWLTRRTVPVWLELLGRIGPAHALVSTKPVRAENRSLQVATLALQKASAEVETLLDVLVGAPGWREARKPVAAAIEVEAGYALSRTGAVAAAELARHAGREAAALAALALETSRKVIAVVGHQIAAPLLDETRELPPGALSSIQQGLRWATFVPALRLEQSKSAVLLHEAHNRV